MYKKNILIRVGTISLSAFIALIITNFQFVKANIAHHNEIVHLATKSAVTRQSDFPKADVKYKNTLAWSYHNSVAAYKFLNGVLDRDVKLTARNGITTQYSHNNTTLKALFKYAITNGFGLQISVAGFENINRLKTNFWCNDSFPNRQSAVNQKIAPDEWHYATKKNSGKKTVKYWSELGNITSAFYGGWSCDYANVAKGAAWLGIGKGYK